jgi:hypothetical protein
MCCRRRRQKLDNEEAKLGEHDIEKGPELEDVNIIEEPEKLPELPPA